MADDGRAVRWTRRNSSFAGRVKLLYRFRIVFQGDPGHLNFDRFGAHNSDCGLGDPESVDAVVHDGQHVLELAGARLLVFVEVGVVDFERKGYPALEVETLFKHSLALAVELFEENIVALLRLTISETFTSGKYL